MPPLFRHSITFASSRRSLIISIELYSLCPMLWSLTYKQCGTCQPNRSDLCYVFLGTVLSKSHVISNEKMHYLCMRQRCPVSKGHQIKPMEALVFFVVCERCVDCAQNILHNAGLTSHLHWERWEICRSSIQLFSVPPTLRCRRRNYRRPRIPSSVLNAHWQQWEIALIWPIHCTLRRFCVVQWSSPLVLKRMAGPTLKCCHTRATLWEIHVLNDYPQIAHIVLENVYHPFTRI